MANLDQKLDVYKYNPITTNVKNLQAMETAGLNRSLKEITGMVNSNKLSEALLNPIVLKKQLVPNVYKILTADDFLSFVGCPDYYLCKFCMLRKVPVVIRNSSNGRYITPDHTSVKARDLISKVYKKFGLSKYIDGKDYDGFHERKFDTVFERLSKETDPYNLHFYFETYMRSSRDVKNIICLS